MMLTPSGAGLKSTGGEANASETEAAAVSADAAMVLFRVSRPAPTAARPVRWRNSRRFIGKERYKSNRLIACKQASSGRCSVLICKMVDRDLRGGGRE